MDEAPAGLVPKFSPGINADAEIFNGRMAMMGLVTTTAYSLMVTKKMIAKMVASRGAKGAHARPQEKHSSDLVNGEHPCWAGRWRTGRRSLTPSPFVPARRHIFRRARPSWTRSTSGWAASSSLRPNLAAPHRSLHRSLQPARADQDFDKGEQCPLFQGGGDSPQQPNKRDSARVLALGLFVLRLKPEVSKLRILRVQPGSREARRARVLCVPSSADCRIKAK